MRALFVVMAALLPITASPAMAWHHSSGAYYRSTDGSMVHRPTRGNVNYGHVTRRSAETEAAVSRTTIKGHAHTMAG